MCAPNVVPQQKHGRIPNLGVITILNLCVTALVYIAMHEKVRTLWAYCLCLYIIATTIVILDLDPLGNLLAIATSTQQQGRRARVYVAQQSP